MNDKFSQKYVITNNCMGIDYSLRPISAIMYFEDCFARYLTNKNLAAFDVIDKNLFWVIAELNIEFDEEQPFWSEEIEVTTWVSEVSKLKIYVDFNIKHNDKIFAKGNSCWFLLNTDSRRPQSTSIVLENMSVHNELMLGEHKKFALPELKEKITEINHKANFSDIDFNNHVHNQSYINIAERTAPKDFINSKFPQKLSVRFNKEAFLNDELTCSAYRTETENTFVHKITKGDVSICDIFTKWADKKLEQDIKNYNLRVRNQ